MTSPSADHCRYDRTTYDELIEDTLDVLRAVAKHFDGTDAPLGSAATAVLAKWSSSDEGALK